MDHVSHPHESLELGALRREVFDCEMQLNPLDGVGMRHRYRRAGRQRRSNCPIACTLDLVGDRWSLLVVRDLLLGKTRFDEFLASEEGIATNILSARLRGLEELGFVVRKDDARDGRRVQYSLTRSGKALGRLVRGIADWGLNNLPQTKLAPGGEKQA